MKWWIFLVSMALVALTTWLILYAGVPLATLLSLGFGAVCLLWLVVILTVPWNVYFGARTVLHEIAASRERGIEIPFDRDDEARGIARRMLRMAVAGHVVSAALIAVITSFSGVQLGYYFSAFYLLATSFRPAAAYLRHLRERVDTLTEEVRHPRLDVVELRDRVNRIDETCQYLLDEVKQARADLTAARQTAESADHDLNRRLTTISRRFDQTVDGLGDNEDLITGLKAFLRLLRSETA